jgi:hydrogenase expression/formation protein HypE
MKLPAGKVPARILEDIVFKNLGVKHKEVAVGPAFGIDGAVVNVGNRSLVISSDPITGALGKIGWLAVNINSNDISTFGVEPSFFLSCILLPEDADTRTVESISTQMGEAATNLGIAIVGGHCEVTPGLSNPIVVGCALGITEKDNYVTADSAKKGDKLILTKSAGIEGTAILASDREQQLKKVLNAKIIDNAKEFYNLISVVKEAIIAYKTGGVDAMHDPTEGGIAGGIHEIAEASGLGVKVVEERIRIQPETNEICKYFQIDPLQLIGSGALLIAAKPQYAEEIVKKLQAERVDAAVIGEFQEDHAECRILRKTGQTEPLPKPISDHLWTALLR